MHVLAALGDAPTAAIAVVAIALGLFFAVRGPREKRMASGGGDGDAPGPAMVTLPAPSAASEDAGEPGFVGPEGEIVGHGTIRLGIHGPLGAAPAPEPAPEPAPAPPPEPPLPAPAPLAQPTVAAASPTAEPPVVETPPQAPAPAEPKDPAWRVAARAANSAVHFRQGTIKLGGKPANKKDD